MTTLARTERGAVEISDEALLELVLRAAKQVDGARVRRPKRSLRINAAEGSARVSLQLAARKGIVLPDLARDVQERVASVLERMCELDVSSVDVVVEEIE